MSGDGVWVLGGYQSDFARNVTKDGAGPHGLVAEVVEATLEEAGAEAGLDGGGGDHLLLLVVLRVELAHGTAAAAQAGVEAAEEAGEATGGGDVARLGVAQPLDGADADGGIKGAGAEGHALPDISQQQVALDVALQSHIQHRRGHVHAHPDVWPPLLLRQGRQDLTRQTATATNV